MKKILYLVLFSIVSISQAQDYWTGLNGPFGGTINDIISPSSGVLLVSTANGVYRSDNAADGWSRITGGLGTDNSFSDLEIDPSSGGTKIFVASNNGARVYVSTDAGVTWSQLSTTGSFSPITKIEVTPNGTMYMIDNSANPRLWKAASGTTSFSNTKTFTVAVNDLDVDNLNKVYVSTDGQGIQVSDDGATFAAPATGSLTGSAIIYSTVINSAGIIFCLSTDGVHKSTDTGVTYALSLNMAATAGIIDRDDTGNIYVISNSGLGNYYTINEGSNWSSFGYFFGGSITATYFQNIDRYFLVVANIGISSRKNGINYQFNKSDGIKAIQPISPGKIFVSPTDNRTLLASGTSTGVGYYQSTNGGSTWSYYFYSASNTNIVGFIKLIDNSVLAYGNGVIRKTDVGDWAQQSTQVLNELVTADGINLFSYSGTNLLSSNDQGVSWPSQAITGLPGSPTKIEVDAANNVYFKVNNEIYKVNSGNTTAVVLTALTATTIQDFQVVGNSVYVLGNTNTVFTSTDNGTSFTSKNAPASSSALWVHDAMNMFLRTTLNNFYVSGDGGVIWANHPLLDTQASATDVAVSSQTNLYVAATNSIIHRKQLFAPVTPTNLITIGKSYDRVEIMWTDNANNEDNYAIEFSVGNNLNYTPYFPWNSGTFPSTFENKFNVAVAGLTKNTQYFFRVKAVNSAGSSMYSNEISVTTLDHCSTTIPNNRSWTGVAEADAGSTPSGPGPFTSATVNIVKGSNPSFPNEFTISDHDFGITPNGPYGQASIIETCGQTFNSEYLYTIANGNGTWNGTNTLVLKWQESPFNESGFQGTTTFTLNTTDPAPAVPVINAYLYSGTEILLNWSAISYAQQYEIERSLLPSSGFAPLVTLNYPATLYLDKNLTANTAYYYRIKAIGTPDASAFSVVVGIALQTGLFRPVENDIQLNFENQQGVSWGDLDGDGDEDIASPSFTNNAGKNVPPVFYENMGNGKDFTRRDLPVLEDENTGVSRGINLFDLNNDGKLDMYIVRSGSGVTLPDLLLLNEGSWNFTKQVVIPSGNFICGFKSAAATDYDQDGLVDVFVGQENAQTLPDLLLKNSDGLSLTETYAGALTNDLGASRGVSWIDYDNDNDQDMFVLNSLSGMPNRLYKNNGDGTFTKVTGLVFDSDLVGVSRTASWGDIDNDGDFDLYVGLQSPGLIDRLYQNNGNGTFTRLSGSAAEENGTTTFGSAFGDIDNDGDLDLIAINTAANSIFLNNGSPTFTFTKYTVEEMVNHPGTFEIGGAFADFDKDGFLDFYPSKGQTATTDLPNFLYRNTVVPSSSKNWIELRLVGILSNKSAIGARVTVTTTVPARTQIREVSTRTGYGSTNSLIVHVGIGTATAISNIQIKWPSGFVQNISNPTINQILTVTEDIQATLSFTPPTTLDSKFVSETFSTNASTNFGSLSGVKLNYRKIGGGNFTELPGVFNVGTSKWDFTVLRSFADGNGLEYYLTAQTGSTTVGRLPINSNTNYYTYLNYKEADNPIPGDFIGVGGAKTSWKIFSIPFDLGSNNNVNTIFNEFTDLDLTDKVDWRMLTYKDATEWGEFPEDFSTITRGKGYFINIKNSVGITIPEASASPNNRKNLFTMPLNQGWNQIGNPYLTPISWADVVAINGLTGTATILKTFSGGSYINATVLNPFEGGFVLAQDPISLISIPFLGQTSEDTRQGEAHLAEGDWMLPMTVQQGDVVNNFGGVGMRSNAQVSFDEYDDFNAPRLVDFIEMNFEHPEHFVKQFARDVVPVQDEYVWPFSFESNLDGVAKLNWSQADVGKKNIFLFDEGLQMIISMKDVDSYSFQPSISKNFKIYFGDNVEKKVIPTRVLLSKAYPNPAAREVNINYTLAESSSSYQVILEVFDVMGKKVATLARGNYNSGFYSVMLDLNQHELPNGIYTCRLIARNAGVQQIQSQKIIIKK